MNDATAPTPSPLNRWQRRAITWLDLRLADGSELDRPIGVMFHSHDFEQTLFWQIGGSYAATAYYARELNGALHEWGLKVLFAVAHATECDNCDHDYTHSTGAWNCHMVVLTMRELLAEIRQLVVAGTDAAGTGIACGPVRDYAYSVGAQVRYALLDYHEADAAS